LKADNERLQTLIGEKAGTDANSFNANDQLITPTSSATTRDDDEHTLG